MLSILKISRINVQLHISIGRIENIDINIYLYKCMWIYVNSHIHVRICMYYLSLVYLTNNNIYNKSGDQCSKLTTCYKKLGCTKVDFLLSQNENK